MKQVEFQKCRGNGYANGVVCAIVRRVLDTKRKNAMNVLKFARGKGLLTAVLSVLCLASFSLPAITQAEWEADHSLIPTPSADSVFYVVAPTPCTGERTVSANVTGLDVTPTERDYYFPFDTELTSRTPGFVLICR